MLKTLSIHSQEFGPREIYGRKCKKYVIVGYNTKNFEEEKELIEYCKIQFEGADFYNYNGRGASMPQGTEMYQTVECMFVEDHLKENARGIMPDFATENLLSTKL